MLTWPSRDIDTIYYLLFIIPNTQSLLLYITLTESGYTSLQYDQRSQSNWLIINHVMFDQE